MVRDGHLLDVITIVEKTQTVSCVVHSYVFSISINYST